MQPVGPAVPDASRGRRVIRTGPVWLTRGGAWLDRPNRLLGKRVRGMVPGGGSVLAGSANGVSRVRITVGSADGGLTFGRV